MFLEIQKYHVQFKFGILCGTNVFFENGKKTEYMERDVKFSN